MVKKHRFETLIYLVLWGILFIEPVMNFYFRMAGQPDATFDWNGVFMVWREYGLFFGLFLIHNYLLAPLLVYRQRKALYFSIVGVLLAGFIFYQCQSRPKERHRHGPRFEQFEHHRPPEFGEERGPMGPPPEFREGMPEDMKAPKPMIPNHRDIVTVIILVLMLGMNLGVKLYFKQRHDQQQLDKLENQNLQQQLEYLKYQINPHFLMNTLNNIHALVDIDPERAKETIVELSKILRFVLYEGSKPTVPLGREMAFLEDYIRLMRMRYSEDKVKVTYNLEPSVTKSQSEVPPLMFITFVENAFKHGISYRQASFIDIDISTEGGKLVFICRNSKAPREEDKQGGVGLQNIKQRLELIYGKNYTLDIDEQSETYNIKLVLPLEK